MSIQELVPSKDICEQLAAAGFPQNTLFYWVYEIDSDMWEIDPYAGLDYDLLIKSNDYSKVFAAPTAEEIGLVLPDEVYATIDGRTDKTKFPLKIEKHGNSWSVCYYLTFTCLVITTHENLAIAMAKMYLYLKSNNLL